MEAIFMAVTISTAACAHVRENNGLLAGAEKRALIWIARRLPAYINSDHLSALGLTAMLGTGMSFTAFLITPWAAVGVVISLVLNWFGDSLDGTLARVRNQQRPRYGYYVDHVIDLAGITILMAGLALSGLMTPLIAAMFLAAYLLVSAETFLATHAHGIFRMSALGVGPTELRILLAIGAIRAAYDPAARFGEAGTFLLFDIGGAISTVALVAIFIWSSSRNAAALYVEEPLPRRVRETAAA
jgi:archaetidylinositol phosphate synthase